MTHGTLVTGASFTQPSRQGRVLLLTALVSAALLAGCASRSSRAPVADHSSQATTTAAQSGANTYVVKAGDTLYQIAQANGIDVKELMRLNDISDPTQLAIGQVLRLNGNAPQSPSASSAAATPIPVETETSGSGASETSTPAQTAPRASDANVISWGWPASGKIIKGFSSSTKGIDIEGPMGAPVTAAASGKVMYAGNGVRGLGNLILLGHSNGFITAYAHNQDLLVKTGQKVDKGDKIATIGQTDTSSPRLHFEIRRRGTPVNPLSYLPAK